MGAVGRARPNGRGSRDRGALPLRPLPRYWPCRRRRLARRLDDPCRASPASTERIRLGTLVSPVTFRPAPGAREERRDRRPHLRRPRRARDRRRLVRAGARAVRLAVPHRRASESRFCAEQLETIVRQWTEDERIQPKPVQQPHPPPDRRRRRQARNGRAGRPLGRTSTTRRGDRPRSAGATARRSTARARRGTRPGHAPALDDDARCIVGTRRGRPPRAREPLRRDLRPGDPWTTSSAA